MNVKVDQKDLLKKNQKVSPKFEKSEIPVRKNARPKKSLDMDKSLESKFKTNSLEDSALSQHLNSQKQREAELNKWS